MARKKNILYECKRPDCGFTTRRKKELRSHRKLGHMKMPPRIDCGSHYHYSLTARLVCRGEWNKEVE